MGRHRRPSRAGLPPFLAAGAIVAVLSTVVLLVQPAAAPEARLVLPAPAPARVTTSAPASTTAPAPTASVTPTAPKVTVKPAPTATKPASTAAKPTKAAAPAPAAKAASAGANPKCHSIGLKPQAVRACDQITAAVPGVTVIYGVGSRPGNPTSCHPSGLAMDLMVYKDKALGDRLYAYIKAHRAELGVTTLLWQVKDHFDHNHASVAPCAH